MSTVTVTLAELKQLAAQALHAAGVAPEAAAATVEALVAADADGLASHGVSRIPFYADQALSGKVQGQARPEITVLSDAAIRVDAACGLAYPAIAAGLAQAFQQLAKTGVLALAITRSHHFGAAGYHAEKIAQAGYLGLIFSNSPAAMAPWGGRQASLGTNPIAFACPRQNAPPLVIDLSLSEVARGKVMLAAKQGTPIPPGWALDGEGQPTTDPAAALAGTMLPLGGAKGAALALLVEILSAALTGSNFAFQASSFFDAEGEPPAIGQFFLLLNPQLFNPGFGEQLETLFGHILAQDGTRLPGARRLLQRQQAERKGITLPQTLYDELQQRASLQGN